MLTVGSLFSGIGGLDLGLERAGMHVKWQCEIDPYCRAVLAHHWPEIKCYEDIRDISGSAERVDLVCGGFPCQPVSRAGRRKGHEDEKWLWDEMARVIRLVQPTFVLVENVPTLKRRGLDRVLADLAVLGYDAEWDCLPAASVGAGHIRDRIFVLAYASGGRRGLAEETVFAGRASSQLHAGWSDEPSLARVVHGVPRWLDRRHRCQRRALGNAVVPQVAELVGRHILDFERGRLAAQPEPTAAYIDPASRSRGVAGGDGA